MKKLSVASLYVAGGIALLGALIHVGAILGGVSWYIFFNAPPIVVASARAGTWLAPISAGFIAMLMALCAAYAFSALGLLRRLPLPRLMLGGMAFICLLRAFILLPLSINHPELRNTFEVLAAIVWGLAGVGFFFGWRQAD